MSKFHFSPWSLENCTLVHKLLEFALQLPNFSFFFESPINCSKVLFIHFFRKIGLFRWNYSSVPFFRNYSFGPHLWRITKWPKIPLLGIWCTRPKWSVGSKILDPVFDPPGGQIARGLILFDRNSFVLAYNKNNRCINTSKK